MRRFRFEHDPYNELWILFLEGVERSRKIFTYTEAYEVFSAFGNAKETDPALLAIKTLLRRPEPFVLVLVPWEPIVIERYHDRAAIRTIEAETEGGDVYVHGLASNRTWWHVAGDSALELRPTVDERIERIERSLAFVQARAAYYAREGTYSCGTCGAPRSEEPTPALLAEFSKEMPCGHPWLALVWTPKETPR